MNYHITPRRTRQDATEARDWLQRLLGVALGAGVVLAAVAVHAVVSGAW